jgi:hypothetical protein
MSNPLHRSLMADRIIKGKLEIVAQSWKVAPALPEALKCLMMLLLAL